MKVVVAKMPGGKAVSVTLEEGATISDAIRSANLEGADGGYEIRKNDEPANLNDTVSHQDIIALTKKIKGNAKQGTVLVKFLSAEGEFDEGAELLKTFPLNAALLFCDVKDEYEKLQIEGYILANSTKSEYNPDDYEYCVDKCDNAPKKWRPLTTRIWIGSEYPIIVREVGNEADVPKVKVPKKKAEEPKKEKVSKKAVEKVEEPKPKKKKASKKTVEKVEEPKPKKKKASKKTVEKARKENKETIKKDAKREYFETLNKCECKGDEKCKCSEPCATEENITPVLNPSPELLQSLVGNAEEKDMQTEVIKDAKHFVQFLKHKYGTDLDICVTVYANNAKGDCSVSFNADTGRMVEPKDN